MGSQIPLNNFIPLLNPYIRSTFHLCSYEKEKIAYPSIITAANIFKPFNSEVIYLY